MRKLKNVLILAGGDSSRFWPLTNKILFKFLGKTLLEHHAESYKKIAENIVIAVNKETRTQLPKLTGQIKIVLQENLDGMAGAVLSARDHITGEVLIVNASDLFDPNRLQQAVGTMIESSPDIAVLAKKVSQYFPGGYLKFADKKIVQIIEKPNQGEEPSDIVKLVVDYFGDFSRLIAAIKKVQTRNDDHYELAVNMLLPEVDNTEYSLYDGFWSPIKYPWHVLNASQYFLDTLKSEVLLGKNVKIAETARIVGPCFIDDNTIVGDFALIRSSHIGKNCLIGGYSEVTRSYLGDNVSLHRNYVGDSVIDNQVLFGAQAATANFRFDEKIIKSEIKGIKIDTNLVKLGAMVGSNSKIGVNATLIPGTKIGKNSLIGPGEIINSDVKDNIFVFKGEQKTNLK